MKTTQAAPVDRDHNVRITEIYASVQGESTHAGRPCAFVRLTGCHLRCHWCDTTYSFVGGTWRSVDSVVDEIAALGIGLVEVTGGEPLVQRGVLDLMRQLLDRGHEVLLETSGSRPVAPVPEGVRIIMDLKAPDSGECEANLWENLEHLDADDEIKIVLASRADYEWARDVIRTRELHRICTVLLSPVFDALESKTLVNWILEDALPVRLNLQLHKFIWSPQTIGV